MNCSDAPVIVNSDSWSGLFRIQCHFWIQRVLLPIVVVIGVVGNLITIVVLTRKRMKCSTNTYLTALAVSDLLLLIFYLLLSFENYPNMKHVDNLPYWEYWRFGLWFADATCGISVWITVSFTVERYIAVCHPLRGRVLCTISRARKVIVVIFIICPILTITTPFEWRLEVHTVNSTEIVAKCLTSMGQNNTYKTIFYWFWSILFVFVPLILLAILNFFLVNAVQTSQDSRRSLSEVRQGHAHTYRERQENKITMILVSVVFLFLVCQTPAAITMLVSIFYSPEPNSAGQNIMFALGTIWNFLVAVNAASNFVLYCFMSDKYRKTLVCTFFPSLAPRYFTRVDTISTNASYRLSSVRHLSSTS